MQSTTQMLGKRRSTAWIRLFGIGAAAALLAVFWMAAGASARGGASATAEYMGWAADGIDSSIAAEIQASSFQINRSAPGARGTDLGSWNCANLRCHYLKVTWSGVTERAHGNAHPFTIALTRNAPSAADIGVFDDAFAELVVATDMSTPTHKTGQQYVGVPWAGERVRVTVLGTGGNAATTVLKIPATDRPAAFVSRDLQLGATLAIFPESELEVPRVLVVWPKVAEATHYELQYTIRTRSSQAAQRVTKVTWYLRAIKIPGTRAVFYGSIRFDWSRHWNAPVLSQLTNADFSNTTGNWVATVASLPSLLADAPDWPQEVTEDGRTGGAEADITAALSQGKNAIGVRVRPIVACGDFDIATNHSTLCSTGSERTGPLALWGRYNRISYVKFEGDNLEEWFSSGRTPR